MPSDSSGYGTASMCPAVTQQHGCLTMLVASTAAPAASSCRATSRYPLAAALTSSGLQPTCSRSGNGGEGQQAVVGVCATGAAVHQQHATNMQSCWIHLMETWSWAAMHAAFVVSLVRVGWGGLQHAQAASLAAARGGLHLRLDVHGPGA
jgi:hypothetical protein